MTIINSLRKEEKKGCPLSDDDKKEYIKNAVLEALKESKKESSSSSSSSSSYDCEGCKDCEGDCKCKDCKCKDCKCKGDCKCKDCKCDGDCKGDCS